MISIEDQIKIVEIEAGKILKIIASILSHFLSS